MNEEDQAYQFSPAQQKLIFTGIFILTFLFIFWTGNTFFDRQDFLAKAVKAKGKVIDFVDAGGDTMTEAPVLEFQDQSGQTYQFQSDLYSMNREKCRIGSWLDIRYDPSNPNRAFTERSIRFPLKLIVLSMFSLTFMGISFLILRHMMSR